MDADAPAAAVLELAIAVLRAGGLLLYPTETLYAFGGSGLDAGAARRTRDAKGRADDKPLPLIAADLDQARSLCASWPDPARRLAARFWPGPLTLVLPARDVVPVEVTAGKGTVAVRVPGQALACVLSRAAGPLISTSANRSGRPPSIRCRDALATLGDAIALALDGGTRAGAPSTIVDVTAHEPRVLRDGAISRADVFAVLG